MSLLATLPGVWRGVGEGHYPTIAPFRYREELTFARPGDGPVLTYAQRTWDADDDGPLHRECGYVRVDGDRCELVIAQPTGITEVHHATVDDGVLAWGITRLGVTASALDVQTVRRRWQVSGDTLTVDLWMTYAGVVDGHHLRAELAREAPPAGMRDA